MKDDSTSCYCGVSSSDSFVTSSNRQNRRGDFRKLSEQHSSNRQHSRSHAALRLTRQREKDLHTFLPRNVTQDFNGKHGGRQKFLLSLSNQHRGCDNRSDPILPHNCAIRYARSLKNLLLCFLYTMKRSSIEQTIYG
ncbi:hypothetical protein F2P81_002728 [Scophthalmus maximus]|uniref:Uncharacterized protein n=1 Tax=Scophthalmus maximus TaxID=52904 RepID=A0A6A4TMY7_SCOMX|nr:hypothetical protein F2P81_002728 [Scophthalmus maximus]